MEWHTNPLDNPYHPFHFDGPVPATYSATYWDYESEESSYIGESLLSLMYAMILTPKPRNTVTGITPSLANAPPSWVS